jgi:hypothetical protein
MNMTGIFVSGAASFLHDTESAIPIPSSKNRNENFMMQDTKFPLLNSLSLAAAE